MDISQTIAKGYARATGAVQPAIRRMSGWTWARPVAKATAATALVVGLAWLGDQQAAKATASAASSDVQVATAGMWTSSARFAHSKHARKHHGLGKGTAGRHDAGAEASAGRGAKGAPSNEADGGNRRRGVLPDGRVVLNEANEAELCKLPGVGPSRAKRILKLRRRLKRFRSVRQLMRVRGIGYRTVRKLGKHLVLDAPKRRSKKASKRR